MRSRIPSGSIFTVFGAAGLSAFGGAGLVPLAASGFGASFGASASTFTSGSLAMSGDGVSLASIAMYTPDMSL